MARLCRRAIPKKDFKYLDDHDGVVTHPELDILECEVKWPLGSTAASKASGSAGIPAELFKILKDAAIKVLEEDMAAHSSILAWRICMDREAWRAAVHGVAKNQTGQSN